MEFTEAAASVILDIMNRRGLDPKRFVFEISIKDTGAVGIGFTTDRAGTRHQYGDLVVMVGDSINMDGMVVDFGEVDGRKGIAFLKEENHKEKQNVDHTDRESG